MIHTTIAFVTEHALWFKVYFGFNVVVAVGMLLMYLIPFRRELMPHLLYISFAMLIAAPFILLGIAVSIRKERFFESEMWDGIRRKRDERRMKT